jgi:hypothetical protein
MDNLELLGIRADTTPAFRERSSVLAIRLFRVAWYSINILLGLAIVFTAFAATWEYSTRRYLTGFSDAIVPATAPGDEKVQAILDWMSHGPARLPNGPPPWIPDRDPTDTLNYEALLRVCGTATNAFINLVDTGKIQVRRLLLLDAHQSTKHVVAEVLIDGRWIIVDPAYRVVFRDDGGKTLTRQELANPATFAAATEKIRGYDPSYTFVETAHIRVERLHIVGVPIRRILNKLAPGWEDSATVTLLVERESFAAVFTGVLLIVFLLLVRGGLRWYGQERLRLLAGKTLLVQCRRALDAFFLP